MANEVDINIGTFDLDNSVNKISISDLAIKVNRTIRSAELPKHHGSIIAPAKRKEIRATCRGTVIGTDYDNLRSNMDNLKAAFESTSEQKFTTDDDRFLWVTVGNFGYQPRQVRRFVDFSFELVAGNPFWYAAVATSSAPVWTSGTPFNATNNGNAPTRVKVTVTANGVAVSDDIKLENVTTGEIFQYRGTLGSTGVLIVNNAYEVPDLAVTKDGVDDFPNFEGDFITLNPGVNSLKFTSGINSLILSLSFRDAWY